MNFITQMLVTKVPGKNVGPILAHTIPAQALLIVLDKPVIARYMLFSSA